MPKTAQITPIKAKCVYVIKKDGTKEEFNVQKVVVAVNKSAYRALVTFTEEELDFICNFVTEKVEQMRKMVARGDYVTAMKIVDTIDWKKVRNANLLSMVATIYEKS